MTVGGAVPMKMTWRFQPSGILHVGPHQGRRSKYCFYPYHVTSIHQRVSSFFFFALFFVIVEFLEVIACAMPWWPHANSPVFVMGQLTCLGLSSAPDMADDTLKSVGRSSDFLSSCNICA